MNCLSNVLYRSWTQKGHLNFKLRSQRAFNNPNLGLGNLDPRSHPTDDRSISTYRARMHVRVHPKYTCLPTVRGQSQSLGELFVCKLSTIYSLPALGTIWHWSIFGGISCTLPQASTIGAFQYLLHMKST